MKNRETFEALKKAVSGECLNLRNPAYQKLAGLGYIDYKGRITEQGAGFMDQYKADNAVILAAGTARRCLPLSGHIPKGLFRVKGEVLIERQIRQLLEAGIDDIYIVTGYMAEKFAYLADKYQVKLIFNPDYENSNNISSVWYAREYLKNTYLLGSDNWYAADIFEKYVYESYYSRFYSKEYVDEYCVELEQGYIREIKKGGMDTWYTLGEIYLNREVSRLLCEDLEKEYNSDPNVKEMIIDIFCMKHIDRYQFYTVARENGDILEFDTVREIMEFDPDFKRFADRYMEENMNTDMLKKKPWFVPYKDVEKYTIHPTDTYEGRLQFNENLWGPSPKCLEVLKDIQISDLNYYDLGENDFLLEALSDLAGVPQSCLFVNAGSSEVLKAVLDVALQKDEYVLIPNPGWGCYKGMIEAKLGRTADYNVTATDNEYYHDIDDILAKAEEYHPKIIILTSPQMPTGNRISQEGAERVAERNPDSLVIVDECYYGCAEMNLDVADLITRFDNIIFVRTLSKIYGLANLRVGYGITNPDLVQLIDYVLPLHKLPNIIRKIAVAAISDTAYTQKNKKQIIEAREYLIEELNKRKGVKAYRSYANFVYISLEGYDAGRLHEYMSSRGITTRLFEDAGTTHMRITVGPKEVLDKALRVFDEGCGIQIRN